MSRLTTRTSIMGRKHDIEGGQAYHWKKLLKNYDYQLIEEAVDKLGELEDIEDELGIDLITLSKALVKGIYTKKFGYYDGRLLSFQGDCFVVGGGYDTYVYYFKDYGKTWALTKEELEKGVKTMKRIVISIRPQWVVKILNGEKTIEVRRGTALYNAINRLIKEQGKAPCLIYCTKGSPYLYDIFNHRYSLNEIRPPDSLNGKVVAEFEASVERIIVRKIWGEYEAYGEHINFTELSGKSCLSQRQIIDYVGESRNGTAIHIHNLKIFDKPKELGEFKSCKTFDFKGLHNVHPVLTKAPQSWCYVEVGE